jgi:hypothetical protein
MIIPGTKHHKSALFTTRSINPPKISAILLPIRSYKTYFKRNIFIEIIPVLFLILVEETFMPRYAIAFVIPEEPAQVRQRIIENETKEAALRLFFNEEAKQYYSDDDQGFYYFKEDFNDEKTRSGSIIEI